ncbi:cell cycle negative regulator roughex [Drosophila innubila]|uniref:cell cycle negative regulator roughex n=1 Tax=Drosophila innubila TaxID=198719 RepID=UPI00148E6640|nr:cell cycle negative regulator roughex [Drosophila innubila]
MEEHEATPTKMMRRFVECVDEGDMRRELSEGCILNIFARCVKGVAAVSGFMRTQLTGRYKHLDFKNANLCDASQELILNNRYERSFQVLRRRLNAKRSPGLEDVAPGLHQRAESDDDADSAAKVTDLKQLATPTKLSAESIKLQYIESIGVLEAHEHSVDDDGGISFESPCKVKLTLGYHRIGDSLMPDICLVIYEKFSSRTRARTWRSLRQVHTDDEEAGEVEGERERESGEPATRSVRRALFSSGADCEESDDSIGCVNQSASVDNTPTPVPISTPNSKPGLTPRKRLHKKDPHKNSKRSMRF